VIKDMLEVSLYYYPVEGGSFPHISGLKFDVNTSMPSYVVLDDREVFIKVDGEYRVENIRVLDSETGEYLPIDLEKKYTVASHSYMLLEQGGGMSMFKDAEVIKNDGMLDVEMLEIYISENLGGVIGEQYAQCDHRINFVDGKAPTQNESADSEIAPVVPSEDGTNVPETIVYTVKWGDTLWALSRAFGCSIDDIVALNSDLIKDPNLIYVGWELTIEQK